jgi:hypothetical protein
MFTASKTVFVFAAAAAFLHAQEGPLDPYSSVKFNLPDGSPVSMMSANYGDSRAMARGGALVLDLHMALTLRNQDTRRIRGITMLVTAQESAPGGRASYSVPTLDVGPGETFPVKIDVRLIRPLQAGSGPLVHVSLDGVLFQGLDFYGPNTLNSRRSLTFWEMENQRDRKYFKQVLAARGVAGLQQEMLDSLARQRDRPGVDVQVSRGGRSTGSAANPDRVQQFAFLELPDSPVHPLTGWAEISGNEARDARIQIRNASMRPVRYVEIGWVVTDPEGKEYMAGSVPAAEADLYLPAHKNGEILQDTSLRFSRGPGAPLNVQSMKGFVSQVEFSDGTAWVPTRDALSQLKLNRLIPPSPEEQRLADLYRKKGPEALVADLNRY